MARYFKSESDKRLDKIVTNPAIKKSIAQWRRDFVKTMDIDPQYLKGCVAYFPDKKKEYLAYSKK